MRANGDDEMKNMHGRFVWYELVTTELKAAKSFYAHVVGWNVRDIPELDAPYSLLTVGETPIAGATQLPEDARKAHVMPHWIGYIAVDDVDMSAGRVQQLGGQVHVQPTDIPNIGRFAIVGDPQMATFALFKAIDGDRPQLDPTACGHVGWHELLATDWKTAFAFYEKLFRWQKADIVTGVMGTYQQFSAGGALIGGMFTKPPTLPIPFWLFYFNVDSIDAAAARATDSGGQILYGPAEVPGGVWIVQCLDPQGAIFAMMESRGRKPVGYSVSNMP
jgi:predicted enzyme related to lactoylglutathione lyase